MNYFQIKHLNDSLLWLKLVYVSTYETQFMDSNLQLLHLQFIRLICRCSLIAVFCPRFWFFPDKV